MKNIRRMLQNKNTKHVKNMRKLFYCISCAEIYLGDNTSFVKTTQIFKKIKEIFKNLAEFCKKN